MGCYKNYFRSATLFSLILLFVASVSAAPGTDYKIDSSLMNALTSDANATQPFFVVFGARPRLQTAYAMTDMNARGRFVVGSLQAVANASQNGVRGYLQAKGITFTPFWIENKIYVPNGTLELARALADRPEVVAILPELIYTIPNDQRTSTISTQAIQWNISKIRADQVWSTSQGSGTVASSIDTGVQYDHPALVNQYRGNTGSGFSHTGNFFDATGDCGGAVCDTDGHGTHTMGIVVGYDGSNHIGVAPAAKWISCKACTNGRCKSSALATCAQWTMDPFGTGTGSGRPHVVNNSWGGNGGNLWYSSYVQNWTAAGIFPAFSIGNDGPSCNTADSPGDYQQSVGAGATDINDVIAGFSSRGPSAFGGIKPDLVAPGVNIVSSYKGSTYATLSGTSMSSPHIAGTVALLWSALPSFVGNVSSTERLLTSNTAVLVTSQTCGGIPAGASPNNTYGAGRVDAYAALRNAGSLNLPPVVSITSPSNGASFECPASVGFSGDASDVKDGNLDSSIQWADNGTAFGKGSTVTKTYDCTSGVGNHSIVASVTDSGGLSGSDSITISITNPSIPAAPSNLTATVSSSIVKLNWQNNATTSTAVLVQRRTQRAGGLWATIATLSSTATTYSDSPGRGKWQYRVEAANGSLISSPSNVVGVTIR